MAGTYRQLKNGKWELCVSLGFDIKGKRIRNYKVVEAKKKKDVEKLLAEFIIESKNANYNKLGNLTLKDFYELWLKDYAINNLRKKTLCRYKSLWIRVDQCLGEIKISEIRPTHLIQFYNILRTDGARMDNKKGGLSTSSIRQHHFLISAILETALTWEIINSNPCRKIKLAKLGFSNNESKEKVDNAIYTLEQTKDLLKIIDTVDIKYKLIIYLAIYTGCRREEILGIEWNDINFQTGEIKIERSSQYTPEDGVFEGGLKTYKSKRSCYVNENIISMLKEYKTWWDNHINTYPDIVGTPKRLFIQKNGSPLHPDTPTGWFRKFLKRNNLPHTRFHNLRHIHGSILLLMGMDMNSVADQMGHADIQMLVKRYSHNIRKKITDTPDFISKALEDNPEKDDK